MDFIASYVAFTNDLVDRLGMTHEMGHVHVGLAIYIGVQTLLRTRRASSIALQAVFGAEIVNEILQRAYYGSWRWPDTIADLLLTVMWPTILYAVARHRRARWTTGARSAKASLMLAPERSRL